jgi:predicted ATP-grasp superfamily ATP-dependent carboligase
VLAHTDAQRDIAVARMLAAGSPALVQEFVTGTPWVVHGVRSQEGTLAVVAARVSALYPRVVGVSSISHSVPCPPALLEDTRRLLDLVGYVGPFCTNALERDGSYFTHDVNLRVAASVALAIRAGLEVPGLGARAALGLPLSPDARRVGVTYVNVDAETSALVDLLRARGGPDGRSVTSALRGTLSSIRGRRVLDPSPVDPVWVGSIAMRLVRKAAGISG